MIVCGSLSMRVGTQRIRFRSYARLVVLLAAASCGGAAGTADNGEAVITEVGPQDLKDVCEFLPDGQLTDLTGAAVVASKASVRGYSLPTGVDANVLSSVGCRWSFEALDTAGDRIPNVLMVAATLDTRVPCSAPAPGEYGSHYAPPDAMSPMLTDLELAVLASDELASDVVCFGKNREVLIADGDPRSTRALFMEENFIDDVGGDPTEIRSGIVRVAAELAHAFFESEDGDAGTTTTVPSSTSSDAGGNGPVAATAALEALIQDWQRLNAECRGSVAGIDDASCSARDALSEEVGRSTSDTFFAAWSAQDADVLFQLSAPGTDGSAANGALNSGTPTTEPFCGYDPDSLTLRCEVEVSNGDYGILVVFEDPSGTGRWYAISALPLDVG